MLYHFSDEPSIKLFTPRIISYNSDLPPVVWAIDEEHCVNYYFPRNCPRIIYGKSKNSTPEDIEKFFENIDKEKVITIPYYMEEELNNAVIYKYNFKNDGFELKDKIAGYYICYHEVEPVKEEILDNLPALIEAAGAELRFTDDLLSLRDKILNSSIDNFSMIKLSSL